jgi:mannose-6-phosphate isomerase
MSTSRIDKPWGWEEILEQNDHYMVKCLFMKQGHACSLQYHEQKIETVFVLHGEMEFLDEEGDWVDKTRGCYFTVLPGVHHRMYAKTDIYYLECSTPHPHDVVRLADTYGRVQSSNHDERDGEPSRGPDEVHE